VKKEHYEQNENTGKFNYTLDSDPGSYSTIKGQSWESLSLEGKKSDYIAYELEVLADIPATKSITTPWYENGVGGGVQFHFGDKMNKLAEKNTEKNIQPKIKLRGELK